MVHMHCIFPHSIFYMFNPKLISPVPQNFAVFFFIPCKIMMAYQYQYLCLGL